MLIALSTSGRSANVLAAIRAARDLGMTTWAMTGHGPNPAVQQCDDALLADSPVTATVQEVHQVAIHLLCEAVDRELLALRAIDGSGGGG